MAKGGNTYPHRVPGRWESGRDSIHGEEEGFIKRPRNIDGAAGKFGGAPQRRTIRDAADNILLSERWT